MFCSSCGAPVPNVAAFCNKCGKPLAQPPAGAPVPSTAAQLIASVLEAPPAAASAPIASAPIAAARAAAEAPARAGVSPTAERLIASVLGEQAVSPGPHTLSTTARKEFEDGLAVEVRKNIDNKCIPVGIVAWIITLIAVARFSIPEFGQGWGSGIGLVMAFVVAGIVTKIMNVSLEDKWVRPIADLSDEMLVNRYNEAKADRRAARTRTALGWAVIAMIAVVLIIAWIAAQRH